MKIHEFQAKELLRRASLPVPPGRLIHQPDEVPAAVAALGAPPWAVKAQIHAGGRGLVGGVRLAGTEAEAIAHARALLERGRLVTAQTGPEGQPIAGLYLESCLKAERELYCSLLINRSSQQLCLILSARGGMDIERVAREEPDQIRKLLLETDRLDPRSELLALAGSAGLSGPAAAAVASFMAGLAEFFVSHDASLVEVNPLALLPDGRVMALDAKMSFDDSALFRHPELAALRDPGQEDPAEARAREQGVSYISLGGTIACMVNGAGLAMATMDAVKLYGAEPANFLDVGGGASLDKVRLALGLMLDNPRVKVALVNIFGGIMRCDVIAEGLIAALRERPSPVPLVVRMSGTNEERGRSLLREAGLAVQFAPDLAAAARLAARLGGAGERL